MGFLTSHHLNISRSRLMQQLLVVVIVPALRNCIATVVSQIECCYPKAKRRAWIWSSWVSWKMVWLTLLMTSPLIPAMKWVVPMLTVVFTDRRFQIHVLWVTHLTDQSLTSG